MDTNLIGSLARKVIGLFVPHSKDLCVMCGQHEANPTQYFEDEMFTWCDTHQENFNLSEFDAEMERLEELAEQEQQEV